MVRSIPLFSIFSPLQEMPCIAHTEESALWTPHFRRKLNIPVGNKPKKGNTQECRKKCKEKAKKQTLRNRLFFSSRQKYRCNGERRHDDTKLLKAKINSRNSIALRPAVN